MVILLIILVIANIIFSILLARKQKELTKILTATMTGFRDYKRLQDETNKAQVEVNMKVYKVLNELNHPTDAKQDNDNLDKSREDKSS